jgi:hypothetical protein
MGPAPALPFCPFAEGRRRRVKAHAYARAAACPCTPSRGWVRVGGGGRGEVSRRHIRATGWQCRYRRRCDLTSQEMSAPMNETYYEFEPEWEKIFTTSSEAEGHLIKGLLEGEGIPCRLHSMRVAQFPLTVNSLGAIEVHVRPQDAPEGRRILYMICSAGKPRNRPEV